MNILLTGVEGFVGKNLHEYFLKNQSYTIFAPTFKELDLTQIDLVERYFADKHIDIIIHSATTLRAKTDYPDNVCELNLKMFFNLVRCMKKGTKILNFGSGSEYSRAFWMPQMREEYFDKHVPMDPHSYAKYLISKQIEESSAGTMVSLKIFGIYGKYEDYRFKFISNAIAKHILGLPIIINQNVDYDYLDVDDFCVIIGKLVEKWPSKYRSYNITPSHCVSLVDIAEAINEVSEEKSEIIVLNGGKGLEYTGDNSRLLEELEDFEFTPYKESIKRLYAYYKNDYGVLDKAALQNDEYLNYAQSLKQNYVDKQN